MTSLTAFGYMKDSVQPQAIDEITIAASTDQSGFELCRFYQAEELDRKLRMHTRYRRPDIALALKEGRFFVRLSPVQLLDVTEQSAAFTASRVLQSKRLVYLKFTFGDGKSFEFKARVVRKIKNKPLSYAVQFLNRDTSFKEHLLKTELKLKFKKRGKNIRGLRPDGSDVCVD